MKASLLAVLNESERLLVAETESAALAPLDEDAVAALHDRVRRARNKYVGQYRRGASARVPAAGGRGKARPANQQAAVKAEAFEEALSRVSRRLAVLARQSAAELRDQRLAAARGSGDLVREGCRQEGSAKKTVTPPARRPSGAASLLAHRPARRRGQVRAAGDRRQGSSR